MVAVVVDARLGMREAVLGRRERAERLVLDVDQVDAPRSAVGLVARDRPPRPGSPTKRTLSRHERVLVLADRQDAVGDREVVAGEHQVHAVDRCGARDVSIAHDARVRLRSSAAAGSAACAAGMMSSANRVWPVTLARPSTRRRGFLPHHLALAALDGRVVGSLDGLRIGRAWEGRFELRFESSPPRRRLSSVGDCQVRLATRRTGRLDAAAQKSQRRPTVARLLSTASPVREGHAIVHERAAVGGRGSAKWRWAALAGLCLSACGDGGPTARLVKQAEPLRSWFATLEMTAERWGANSVPRRFALAVGKAAEKELAQRGRRGR